MKIELEEPYKSIWRLGYLVTNPEGRKTVILYNSHSSRSSTSYARYVMSVNLGRVLEKYEHVDHIDNDKTNDGVANLQLLSLAENNLKRVKYSGKEAIYFDLVCPICGTVFKIAKRNIKFRPNATCSRSCGYRSSAIKLRKSNVT